MATEDIMREPPPPPPDQPMDLSAVQAKIKEAFESGNFSELARLNALAREISNRLTMSTRSDERFKRVQMNPDAASDADRAYADSLIRNLGAARQMVESTQRASEVEDAPDLDSPGPSVGEEVAGTAGALGAADVAGRAASSGAVGRSQAAATAAKKGLERTAGIATDRAVADQFVSKTAQKGSAAASAAATKAAREAGQANLRARAARVAPPGRMGREAPRVVAETGAKKVKTDAAKAATGAAAKTAKETAEVTTRQATKTAAEAATKRATARGFAATAARAAPRIFGAMPMALAEVAIAPIAAFYKTTEQTKSFLGRLEKLAEMKGGPLGVDDLNTDTLDVLSTSPTLVDSMLKSGVIDNTAYAFANPEGAAEMGITPDDSGQVQRGGDIFTVGDVEGARAAEPGEDFGRRDPRDFAYAPALDQVGAELQAKMDAIAPEDRIGRIGEDLPDESTPTTSSAQIIEEDDSTPVARSKAVQNAMKKIGPNLEIDTRRTKSAKFDDMPEMASDKIGLSTPGAELALERVKGRNAMRKAATPKLAPPKERKIGKGLQKLLETFSTMDLGKGTGSEDLGV